ncbi:hypothetical protein [Prosthecobacter sp.]|jgi:hypothetical protein|nr:hypothetical protein [Prosthecobacter sp.]
MILEDSLRLFHPAGEADQHADDPNDANGGDDHGWKELDHGSHEAV